MSAFYVYLLGLCALAGLFVAWPLLGKKQRAITTGADEQAQHIAANRAVYAEALAEYQHQLASDLVSQEEFARLKKDLDAQLARDIDIVGVGDAVATPGSTKLLIVVTLLVPAVSLLAYSQWGAIADWEIDKLAREQSRLEAREPDSPELVKISAQLNEKLTRRVKQEPDNFNNWMLLGRAAFDQGQLQESILAYQTILDARPNSPQVLAELAQVVYVGAGNKFVPEVKQLYDRALMLDSLNLQILSLAGFNAFQGGDFVNARDYWQRIVDNLEPTDSRYETWQRALTEANRQLAAISPDTQSETAPAPAQDGDAPRLRVQVSVDPAIAAKLSPTQVVFIYARAMAGPKMPLAMVRTTVAALPTEVYLDASSAMMPNMTLAEFDQVELVARVSLSGSANAQSGDWQAAVGPVSNHSKDTHHLLLNQQLP